MTHLNMKTLAAVVGLILSTNVLAFGGAAVPEIILPAPGYGELDFKAPSPGSYKLPVLGFAKNVTAVNTDNKSVSYHELFRGKYTLLNFMYTRCDDINGCPLTHVVFNRIKSLAKKEPILAQNLQMLSMSFDPKYDTPELLKKLESGVEVEHVDHSGHDGHTMADDSHQMSGVEVEHVDHSGHDGHTMADDSHQMSHAEVAETVDWRYLTTHTEEELAPILEAYNQSVITKADANSKDGGNFSHILRVFLIDPDLRIRNIYSVSFLHPDIIINDLKTIMMEYGVKENTSQNTPVQSVRIGARDSKDGYESKNYITNSLSVESRIGKETNLMEYVENPPLGLPEVPVPKDNPVTEAKIKLGKKMFYDRRLSLNNTISCAICHVAEQGFTNHEMLTAIGFEGRSVRRNAPTIYNTAYLTKLFHDGRETTLENQAWQPMLANNEMANPSFGHVIEKLRQLEDYTGLFEAAFDGQQASLDTIPKAIATYQRTLNSANSPFDRWYYGKENNAMTESAIRGFNLFSGKANCIQCHTVTKKHALFTDNGLHNTGIGWERSMKKEPETQRVQLAPGRYVNVESSIINSVGNQPQGDLGHYEVTQDPDDRWKYRTPSLRNIALTAPYMHDGSISSLEEIVSFYNQGGIPNETQSPLINPLNLSGTEMNDLVKFLESLNGDNVTAIISDSFATPIGDYTN
jgi:cytochrome c peroxidase